jgi:hypothetical protein
MYAQIHDTPATPEMYRRVLELLGDESPAGLVVHVALARPEGGVRFVDVWESQEAYAAFHAARLDPAVSQMLTEHGIPTDQGPAAEGAGPEGPDHAPTHVFEVVDLMLGDGAGAAISALAAARPS